VVISVRDTGMGIEPEMLPRIFNMFAQAASPDTRQGRGGLGIGLALAKQLIEMHGGKIEGKSEGRGRGSEFIVRLPLAKRQLSAVPSASPLAEADRLSRPSSRILIVDDNRDAASSLGMLLKMLGHEIEIANDGVAALDVMQSFRPTVALLDLGMPGMTGYEVVRRAHEMPECKDTIFVALTGWGQEEDRRKTREAGFNHHLLKPVNLGALEVLLSEATERASAD
jgi:CheY-like chemotaxis protein